MARMAEMHALCKQEIDEQLTERLCEESEMTQKHKRSKKITAESQDGNDCSDDEVFMDTEPTPRTSADSNEQTDS